MQLVIVILSLFSAIVRGSISYDSPEDRILIENSLCDYDTHFRIDSDEEEAGPQVSVAFPFPVFVKEVHIKPGQLIDGPIEAVKGTRYNLNSTLRMPVVAKIYGAAQVVAVNVQQGKFYLSGHPMFDYVDKSKPDSRSVAELAQDQGD
jgi:hypothetical protein